MKKIPDPGKFLVSPLYKRASVKLMHMGLCPYPVSGIRMLCIGNNTYADGIKQTGTAGFFFFSAPVFSFTGSL